MATYKEIKGTQIEAVASDPSNPVEGQVWYNTTSNALKGEAATAVGAWATGGALNTTRNYAGGAGTYTAGLAFGGQSATPSKTAATETYNGSNWTSVNSMNTARRQFGGTGTQTAAITANDNTELWNGTNWTETTDLNTPRTSLMTSRGSSTSSVLVFGGISPAPATVAVTESWNGSAWTEVNDLNTARQVGGGAGSGNTSALCFAGYSTTAVAITESWNGSNWTEVNDLNQARSGLGGTGTQTAAIAFAGYNSGLSPGYPTNTEIWNGTNWTEDTNLSTAGSAVGSLGTSTNALAFGGSPPVGGAFTNTEEWTGAGVGLTRTFTDS